MEKIKVIVGLGSCGIAAGANKTYEKIAAMKKAENLDFELKKTSCIGMCFREPLVEVIDQDGSYLYGEVDEDKGPFGAHKPAAPDLAFHVASVMGIRRPFSHLQ